MCGIVGYIGKNKAKSILVAGIKKLEYRGYDSSGLAVIEDGVILCKKAVGRISELEKVLDGNCDESNIGIIHTRWATHGAPTYKNAHPHVDCANKIALVHNGIIENYNYLKTKLQKNGHILKSETDTEVIVHFIESYYEGNLEDAVRNALKEIEGAYGLAIIHLDEPEKLVAARHGSPLIIGIGNEEYFVTSDVSAIIEYTKNVVYLDDGELVVLTKDSMKTTDIDSLPISKRIEEIQWDVNQVQKSGYEHFMLKEIYEQPQTLRDTMLGRFTTDNSVVRLGGLQDKCELLRSINRSVIVACGTSWHAGLIGEYMLEELMGMPVEVEYASEFRYRDPIIEKNTMIIAISQSGETADTLAAIREAKRKGAVVLAICNVVGSSIARESDCGIFLHAGPEIGVASTKAFTSQIVSLFLLTMHLRQISGKATDLDKELVKKLKEVPSQVQSIFNNDKKIKEISRIYKDSSNILYLGRGYNYPVALEGALKLKEISYIHAEGYPAAEMKHGPIALVDKNMPVVFIATKDATYSKILSNIEEIRARGGKVIAIASEGDSEISKMVEHVLYIPETVDALTPILSVIPLQLLSYHMAVMRGCDVDKPRNLAKSVTVE
ncbi:MAG: glutamine--fructose-6-phosphate transaminase (isomerizing) [Candidatus Scalindua sp. AMX11]|nr:MAG: glutamine--fructose-6-phosphate transaminase (isomerizing) [Candidatus Scalindua sp.]NOG83260.1 glutamine--fructose-6-phosphate transaminase (isomerizing) [Planctomycetota bacterium]RZV71978.1 MAG: glutamine--fructose-6-phosphate transaminase (isomerizing) [Candidatus Scalindua sp. SCAELEC01]TDE63372.1 MAG: glutamine--fructose-6-phosphate transaminase (isomerizing) [Candidatus Scalindua sp. AMX11]GJQ60030.1 MAG: glutamine--fructose-6-phosphate aminotransferase [isomerizing] [Candidatus 